MIIPPDSSKELLKNRSVFDLKVASRRDSVAHSVITVPPSYESALSDASPNQLLPLTRAPGNSASSEASYSTQVGSENSSPTPSFDTRLHRHRFHWHNDPHRHSIVLHIEKVLFKVQPDILRNYCPLLSDFVNHILSSSQLPVDSVDGFKCYYLAAIRSQDIAELLNRVYHLHRTAPESQSEPSLRSIVVLVTPLLQYSTKTSPALRNKCITSLESHIPTNTGTLINRNRQGALRCQGDTAFKILNLVRTAGPNARHLLPFSFFLCARSKTADIMESSLLSWQDKAYCLAGRDEISRILRFDIYRKYTSSEVFSPQHCRSIPKCCTSVTAARTLDKHLSVDLFGFFTKVDCICCANCVKEMQYEVKQRWLERVWENLPMLFRLGTWEALGVGPEPED